MKKLLTYLILLISFKIYSVELLENIPNFPISTQNNFFSSGAVADINADGIKEFIIGDKSGIVYALNSNGINITGFPVQIEGEIWSSPAIGDIDNDGLAEIVIGTNNAKLYVIETDGTIKNNFPFSAKHNVRSTPVLFDINNDGKLEIIFSSRDGWLYVLNEKGESIDYLHQRIVKGTTNENYFFYGTRASPLILDYDKDGNYEILLGTNGGYLTAFDNKGKRLFIYEAQNRIDASPFVYDWNKDGNLEIIVPSWDKNCYAFNFDQNYNLKFLPGFPVFTNSIVRGTPVIYEDNEKSRIISLTIESDDNSYLKNHQIDINGNFYHDTDKFDYIYFKHASAASILTADMDNDEKLELISGTHNGIFIYSSDFDMKYSDFLENSVRFLIESTPVISDFNDDGKIDLIVGAENQKIYCYTTNKPINYNLIDVYKFRNNLNNSGNYYDFSTPLIYEPKQNVIHSDSILFKWINMERFPNVKSSYSLNNSTWTDSELLNEKLFTNLEDGKYIFKVKQFFNTKQTFCPGIREIIIDRHSPIAKLYNKDKYSYSEDNVKFFGIANDSNFLKYNITITDSENNILIDSNYYNPVDSETLFTLDTLKYRNGIYFLKLKVYEINSDDIATDTLTFHISNKMEIINNEFFYELLSSDKKLKLFFHPNNFQTDIEIQLLKNFDDLKNEMLSDYYKINFPQDQLIGYFEIKFNLDEINLPQKAPSAKQASSYSNISIFYSIDKEKWKNIGGIIDSELNEMKTTYNKSGYYIIGTKNLTAENISEIKLSNRLIDFKVNAKINVLNADNDIKITVYDINGKKIKNINKDFWDGTDYKEKKVTSGLYIMIINLKSSTKKFVVYVK